MKTKRVLSLLLAAVLLAAGWVAYAAKVEQQCLASKSNGHL